MSNLRFPFLTTENWVWGSLFNSATICPEVVERPFDRLRALSNIEGHQNQNALDSSPTKQGYLSTDPYLCLSSIPLVAAMGAATSNDVLWVANLKRDPHTPKTVFGLECNSFYVKKPEYPVLCTGMNGQWAFG